MLDMMREFGFAPALNRLTQAWEAKSRGKSSAEPGLVDKLESHRFTGDPARRDSTEMMVTMGFEKFAGYHRRAVRQQGLRLSSQVPSIATQVRQHFASLILGRCSI